MNSLMSPNFEAWFVNSKVRAGAAPLVVYHGTATAFTRFSGGRGAYYFTDAREMAEQFARHADGEDGPLIVEAYLSIQNPVVFDGKWYLENMLDDAGEPDWGILDNALYDAETRGHDGAILNGIPDFAGMVDGVRVERVYNQFIAFTPGQIKSVRNCGRFDPRVADMYQ